MTNLTVKQRRFVEEYLIDENAPQAAVRSGYSPVTAKSAGYRLLKHKAVKEYLEDLKKTRLEKMGITQDRVLQELAMIAFANLQDIVEQDEDGATSVNLKNLKREHAAAIAGISVEVSHGRTTVKKTNIKLNDKQAALEKIGKHLGMFQNDNEQHIHITLEQLVRDSFNLPVLEGEVIPVKQVEHAS